MAILIILSLFSLDTTAQSAPAQQLAGFEYDMVIKGQEKEHMPLLIAFHYSGGTPNETRGDYDSLRYPVRIIFPRGNYKKRNGFSYFPTSYYQEDSATQSTMSRKTVDSLAAFVMAAEKLYSTKAIVAGISQGGDIALLLAARYPQLCRASFPFAAVISPALFNELTSNPVTRIPIYLFQGEDDKIIPVQVTRQRVKEIGNKLDIRFTTYPGLGHDISPQMKHDYSKMIDRLNRE